MIRRRLGLLPALAVLAVVVLVPLGRIVWTSLHRSTTTGSSFNGIANFRNLLTNENWWLAVATSLVVVAAIVLTQVVLGLILGTALHRVAVAWPVTRVLVLLPFTLLSVVNVIAWRNSVTGGYLSQWFDIAGSSHLTQFLAVAAGEMWRGTGLVVAVVAIALAAVPAPLVEATIADGATSIQRWRRVAFPFIAPAVAGVAAFRVFDTYRVLDGPLLVDDPSANVSTGPLLTWTTQFTSFELGLGAAMSLIVLVVAVVVAAMIVPLFRVRRLL